MFATRTLARAPVAGRLAGSVSTLRVASLSAFTSGSKLAGFFGRASGQSGAPAFQQLGLRMSLCRAFSSQPPIQKLTLEEKIALGSHYTLEKFKFDYLPLVETFDAAMNKKTISEKEKSIYSRVTTMVVLAVSLVLDNQRVFYIFQATRDYRLQLLKEQGLEAYFDEVKPLMQALRTRGTQSHHDMVKELGLSADTFGVSAGHYYSTDPRFESDLRSFWNKLPAHPTNRGPGVPPPKLPNVLELHARLLAYAKECLKIQIDPEQLVDVRRVYVADRLVQETGVVLEQAEQAFSKELNGTQLLDDLIAAFKQNQT